MEKRKDIVNLYIPPGFQPIWGKFGEIADREGRSKSAIVRRFVARYVAIHDEGNPQLMLSAFMGEIKKSCYKCEGSFPFLIPVKFASGIKAGVCSECFDDYDKRGLIKRDYRKKRK